MGKRKNHSAEELKLVAEHLYYEIWMLRWTTIILSFGVFGDSICKNAFVESFAIHTRNLIEFLFDRKAKVTSDTIVAEHYFPDPATWRDRYPQKSKILQEAWIRANKQIAHMSTDRKKREKWNQAAIWNALCPILRDFVNKAPKDKFGDYRSLIIGELVVINGSI